LKRDGAAGWRLPRFRIPGITWSHLSPPSSSPVLVGWSQRRRRNRLDGALSRPSPARWSIEPVRISPGTGRQSHVRSMGRGIPARGLAAVPPELSAVRRSSAPSAGAQRRRAGVQRRRAGVQRRRAGVQRRPAGVQTGTSGIRRIAGISDCAENRAGDRGSRCGFRPSTASSDRGPARAGRVKASRFLLLSQVTG